MKKTLKIILLILIPFAFLMSTNSSFATSNLNTWWSIWWQERNSRLGSFFTDKYITLSSYDATWARNLIIVIAKDIKNIFYMISTVYFLIISIKIIVTSKTEESVESFKKWIIWITIWIIVMQVSYSFVLILFDKDIWWELAYSLIENLIDPLLMALETITAIFFMAIAIYSFYRIITANGNEEKIKSWRMSVLYAIIWYIVMKFARTMVSSMYGRINCESSNSSCLWNPDLWEVTSIVITIINWANSFIAIIVILILIYAWFNIMLSWWDDEKIKRWKNTIIYIIIWLIILAMNYMILTFFL